MKIQLRNSTLINILILTPFLMPGGLLSIPGLEKINILFHLLKIVSILVFVTLNGGKVKIKGWDYIIVFLFGASISITNFIHSFDVLAFRNMVFFISFFVICRTTCNNNRYLFFKSLTYLTAIYNIIQAITIVIYYPNGLNHYVGYYHKMTLAGAQYFFGSKNQMFFYMMLFLVSFFIMKKLEKPNKKSNRLFLSVIGIFLVESWVLDTANTIVCLVIFSIFYFLIRVGINKRVKFLFNPYMYIILSICIFFIICIFSLGENIKLVGTVFNLIGRDLTFTNRIYIWEITQKLFWSSPLIGVGEVSFRVLDSVQQQAHNMYLDVLYKYGVVAFIPFISIMISMGKKLRGSEKSDVGALMVASLFLILLHNCFDAMDNYIFIVFYSIYANVSDY